MYTYKQSLINKSIKQVEYFKPHLLQFLYFAAIENVT